MQDSTNLIENEFEHNSPAIQASAGMVAAAAREQHEIQAAMTIAKKFPRDEANAYSKIMKSFSRSGLAEDAVWGFPRGGKKITGPSVHCAREIARCWTNLNHGLRVVDIDERYAHIKGRCFDWESNVCIEAEDKFEMLIQRKNYNTGITEWVTPDERDGRELINRRGAILVRNCILQCIPPDLIDDAVQQAAKTMQLKAANQLKENREDTVKGIIKYFVPLGVNVAMLSEYLGHGLDLITEEQLTDLRTIARSLKDGNSKREEIFNVKAASAGAAELNKVGPIAVPGDIVIDI